MHSLLLLVAVSGLIAVPGVPAALLAFRPGQAGPPAMAAAAFGLGFTATGGCAFALAAAHAFTLAAVLGCWLAVSAALWAAAWRYGSPREHAAALAAGIREQRLPLAAGTVILVALLILHLRYLYLLNGPRYVYYLNGMQIARAGGIPAATLEYGQAWPPATDKVYLDSFTGIVALLSPNPVPGPGVLLLIATFGSVLGLWAVAWETGLRWASALLPVLCAGNQFILPGLSITSTEYRAEDFGRAVACCALAAGIVALREPSGRTCLAAAAVLAAASGSHLIPVLAVVLALGGVAIWLALSARGRAARLTPLAWCAALLALAAAGGAAVKAFAGGTLGLAGAQDPAGYHAVRTWFDPTAYLFNGEFVRRASAGGWHWYLPPSQVIDTMVTGIARLPWWQTMALLVIPVAAAAALALRRDRGAAAAAGLGLVAGGIGVALLFDLRFPVYVDATFGMRRLSIYVSAGLFLLALGLLDLLPEAAARLAGRPRSGRVAPSARAARVAPAAAGCVIAVAATAVLVPGSVGPASLSQVSAERGPGDLAAHPHPLRCGHPGRSAHRGDVHRADRTGSAAGRDGAVPADRPAPVRRRADAAGPRVLR